MFRTVKKSEIFLFLASVLAFAGALFFLPPFFLFVLFLEIVLIVFSIKKMEIGISFLAVYILFDPLLLKFASDDIFFYLKYGIEPVVLILFLIAIIKHFFYNQGHYIKTPIDIFLGLFILISLLSALFNLENPAFWLLGLRQIGRYILLYYTVIYSKLSLKSTKRIIFLLFILMAFEAMVGIGQIIIGQPADDFLLPDKKRVSEYVVSPGHVDQFWSPGERAFATTGRYDILGTWLCLGMVLASGLLYQLKNNKYKIALLTVFIVSLPALLFTYSRMSWLGLAGGLFLIGVLIKKDKKLLTVFLIAAILLIGYLSVWSNRVEMNQIVNKPEITISERFLSLFSFSAVQGSYEGYGRLYFIVNTPAKVVKNYPFFGVGLGQYGSGVAYALHNTEKYDELGLPFGIQGYNGQIDNNWFSLWGEVGTLGVLAFLFIIIKLFKYAKKVYKASINNFSQGLALGFLGVILAVSFQAFLGPYFEVRILSFYFWLLAGLVVNLGITEREGLLKKIHENTSS